jgi:uncharacterized protein YecT (DUF1311 family)
MMRTPALPALLFGLAVAGWAVAGPAAADRACEAKAMDQASINACAQQDLQAADAELNRVYRAILKRHAGEPVRIDRIRAAQRAWIRSRDSDLEARFPLAPGENAHVVYGSIHPYEHASAKAELTRLRTAYLRRHFLDAHAP